MSEKDFFVGKKFGRKNVWQEIFLFVKIFGSEFFLDRKKLWVGKNFGSQKIVDMKKIWSEKFVDWKKILVAKFFGS